MLNRILVVTNDCEDASALKDALGNAADGAFEIECTNCLSDGLKRLEVGGIDAIMVDLSLPDSNGIATFERLFAVAPHTPIMTLSADGDETLATQAMEHGAQGCLAKEHFSSSLARQMLRNLIQRKRLEEKSYQGSARAEIALNSIGDAVLCTDMLGNVDYMNVAAEKMTRWSREDASGRPIADVLKIINAATRQSATNPVDLVLHQDKQTGLDPDTILVRRDGSEVAIEDSSAPIHDWDGQIAGAVIVFRDVSAAQAMIVEMAYQAQHDFLTNLPNRVLLNDRIAQAIELASRHGTKLAVLFVDLDNFKQINDALGHAVGDKLLQSITKRLLACVRTADTVSRQGGDEFVILLAEGKHEENAAMAAARIIAVLSAPHRIADNELDISASIGISAYPADGKDAETLIKNADAAMYHAKQKGRNNYQFFSDDMNTSAIERQFIETNLRLALGKREFMLHYQPIVNLDTGVITGGEALLRWRQEEKGMVLPDRFISIAEDCGLIVPIGRWVLNEACTQAKQWIDAGLGPFSIAVNISALEFRQAGFLDTVRGILDDTGLDPRLLQLEITESVLMHDVKASAATLQELKNLGLRLAVDDFGTGYSSLSYLKQFPIDILKIDRSFVHDIAFDTDDGIIVSAVIAMGNSLKKRVIAEGVEKLSQLNFLRARHCEEGQGYLFSRPVAAEQFAAMLKAGTAEAARPREAALG
jgi:diguanylate cyclase (GGDEF)-like protein/PAS domain S-box-containing protein